MQDGVTVVRTMTTNVMTSMTTGVIISSHHHYTSTLTLSLLVLLHITTDNVSGKGAKVRVKSPNKQRLNNNRDGGRHFQSPQHSQGGATDDSSTGSQYASSYVYRNATGEELLLNRLFRNYDPVARAVMDVRRTVVVSVDFLLLRIHGLEERSQVLTTTGLVIAEWKDDRLTWSPENFNNLTDIIVKPEQIWLPELALMNGAEELQPDYFERMRVLLRYDGRLHWEPGGVFRTTCDIDITLFPFDSQHCPMLVGAYSYFSTKMNITNGSSSILTHDLQQNGEWHVTGTTVQWGLSVIEGASQSGDGYAHVIFTLHLDRRYKFYLMNIVLPCIMLSVLIMVSFFLPPEAGEKISLGISVLLAFTVFLMMIAENIPRTSLAIPLIVIYLMSTMTLGTTSICLTVFVLNVHHRSARPVPAYMRCLVLKHLAQLLHCQTTCRRHDNKKTKQQQQQDRCDAIFQQKYLAQELEHAAKPMQNTAAKKNNCFQPISCSSMSQPIPSTTSILNGLDLINLSEGSHVTQRLTNGAVRSTSVGVQDDEQYNEIETTFTELTARWQQQRVSNRRIQENNNNTNGRMVNNSLPILRSAVRPLANKISSVVPLANNRVSSVAPLTNARTSAVAPLANKRVSSLAPLVKSSISTVAPLVNEKIISSVRDGEERMVDHSVEWRELSRVLDRLFFFIICILMTSSTLLILLYPKHIAPALAET